MPHLTSAEAGTAGPLRGITGLFPVSSLGHAVLMPTIGGGQRAQDLNVSDQNNDQARLARNHGMS